MLPIGREIEELDRESYRIVGMICSERVPEAEVQSAIEALRGRGVPFALGGGLAFCAYSDRWRRLKDVDLFLLPRDRDAAVEAISSAGFRDYFDVKPYDRKWIYRGHRSEQIIDLISKMANYRNEVEEDWFRGGGEILLASLLRAPQPVLFLEHRIAEHGDLASWRVVPSRVGVTRGTLRTGSRGGIAVRRRSSSHTSCHPFPREYRSPW